MAYSFDHFAKTIKQKTEILPLVIAWLQYLSTSFGQRQARGKTEQEFANIVLTAREQDLPPEIMQFLLHNIYPFLRDERLKPIQETLAQLPDPPTSNLVQSFKLLRNIMSLPVTEAAGKRSLFGWLAKKGASSNKPANPLDEQTFISAGPPVAKKPPTKAMDSLLFHEDTIASSKPAPMDKKLEAVLRQQEEAADTVPLGRSLSLMQRLTSSWGDAKVQTILKIGSPLMDVELETLRMQTLVSLKKPASVLVWKDVPKEEELKASKPDEFFKMLQGISNRPDVGSKVRALLTQLKNGLTIRTKLLSDPQIIRNILHEGLRSFHHTLDRLSQMTDQAKINKKIWAYLHHLVHAKLLEESDVFRRKFLACTSCEQLEDLLAEYRPTRNILKKYPNLKLIVAIQKTKVGYDRDPGNLMRVMNKCLGVYGEANIKDKLSRLFLTSEADAAIAKEILSQSSVSGVQAKLAKLQSKPNIAPTAQKLSTLISTFLDIHQHLGFPQFVASINQSAPAIRQKLIALMRQYIQKELSDRLSKLLHSSEPAMQRLAELQKILDSTRYHDSAIQMYGYDTKTIYEKLQAIKPSQDPNLMQMAKHIFSSPQIPAAFFELVVKGKKAIYRAR